MPAMLEPSSVRSVCAARPIARLLPRPATSSVFPSAAAHATASTTSLSSRGFSVSVIGVPLLTSLSWPGSSRPSTSCFLAKAWMPGTRPGMTKNAWCARSHFQHHALESWQIRKRQLAGVDVHAAEFGAAVQLWKYLAGIQQALVVEGAFQPLLLGEIDFGEHRGHQVALLDADAVLAGQDAADLDAKPEDVSAESFGTVEFVRLVRVIENERMQITVASVKDVGDAELVVRGQFAHPREHQRKLRSRDGAIHAVIVG